ncbi:hypothetical protein ACFYRL_19490 [Streptomyces goshikiensis]|uniref:hypothetical protein n=1 Tax=Streptomyces goshikiensis TaxID=1942 RepID=UPI0036A728D4
MLHERCAGLDITKKDALLAVPAAVRGRGPAGLPAPSARAAAPSARAAVAP